MNDAQRKAADKLFGKDSVEALEGVYSAMTRDILNAVGLAPFKAGDKINRDWDRFNRCPTCGTPVVNRCRCPEAYSICASAHVWCVDLKTDTVRVGDSLEELRNYPFIDGIPLLPFRYAEERDRLIPVCLFITICMKHILHDSLGTGQYATLDGLAKGCYVLPSDVLKGKTDTRFSHVSWDEVG